MGKPDREQEFRKAQQAHRATRQQALDLAVQAVPVGVADRGPVVMPLAVAPAARPTVLPAPGQKLVTLAAAAQRAGCSVKTYKRRAERNELPPPVRAAGKSRRSEQGFTHHYGRLYVDLAALDKALQRMTEPSHERLPV